MITQAQCKCYAEDYQSLGRAAEISVQRATTLMAISQSWTRLAGQLGRLAAIEAEEEAKPVTENIFLA